jgi:hypothetical protein
MSEKKEIKISTIKKLLDEGKTRIDIAEYFNLTGKEVKDIFTHPKLKGLRVKVAPSYILLDEEEDETAVKELESYNNRAINAQIENFTSEFEEVIMQGSPTEEMPVEVEISELPY